MSDENAMRWLDEQWPTPTGDPDRFEIEYGGHLFEDGRCRRPGCSMRNGDWWGEPCEHIGPWQGPRRPTFADYAAVVAEFNYLRRNGWRRWERKYGFRPYG